jgi:hypothetical protein
VTAFFKGKYALGVEGQFSNEQDRQPVDAGGTCWSLPETLVEGDLVGVAAVGGVKAQRTGDAVSVAEHIEPSIEGLPDGFVALSGVIRPLAGDASGGAGGSALPKRCPEQPVQVVAFQLITLDPPIVGAPVHDLHQLQAVAGRRTSRPCTAVVAYPRPSQHDLGIGHDRHKLSQVIAVIQVV